MVVARDSGSASSVSEGCVTVGLSGGVDSSVAALLLKQAGYRVRATFMKNWEDDDTDTYCSSREDFLDAVAVADRLGIDIDAVNFATNYREQVFASFLSEYAAGRTPNPDILCNTEIKFRAFLHHALAGGADKIATGHYARIERIDGAYMLLKALDASKDQSYFLYGLQQDQLARALFPLGKLAKKEVRQIAQAAGLLTCNKKDSTGICFIGERNFREFLGRYIAEQPGEIQDLNGRVLGQHSGVSYFTLGQRGGLGIGGVKGTKQAPWYVYAKDVANNILFVGQDRNNPTLLSGRLVASKLSWVSGRPPLATQACQAKTRYRQPDQPCLITALDDDACTVEFRSLQWAVTPGQSVVFYRGDQCLGGGVIESTDALSIGDAQIDCPKH